MSHVERRRRRTREENFRFIFIFVIVETIELSMATMMMMKIEVLREKEASSGDKKRTAGGRNGSSRARYKTYFFTKLYKTYTQVE